MGRAFEAAPPQVTLAYLRNHHVLPDDLHAVPVALNGRFLGVVTRADMQRVRQEEWGATRIVRLMSRAERLPTMQPGGPPRGGCKCWKMPGLVGLAGGVGGPGQREALAANPPVVETRCLCAKPVRARSPWPQRRMTTGAWPSAP
jgi:hypothetical protein